MFSNKLKERSYYERLKGKIGIHSIQWKSLSGRPYVGDCSYLYDTLKPTSYQDFFDKYISFLNPEKEIGIKKNKLYGRSIDDLIRLAEEYKRRSDDDSFTLEEYFDDIVCHVIIETYDGHQAEQQLINILEKYGFEVENPYGKLDAELGVDLIVKKNGIVKDYIQVKPLSTFIHNHNPSLIADRVNFFSKQVKLDNFINESKDPSMIKKNIIYMLYDYKYLMETGKVKWLYKGNKVKFSLTDLIDTNGKAINRPEDFERKELILK